VACKFVWTVIPTLYVLAYAAGTILNGLVTRCYDKQLELQFSIYFDKSNGDKPLA
jgi:hypothetical protein